MLSHTKAFLQSRRADHIARKGPSTQAGTGGGRRRRRPSAQGGRGRTLGASASASGVLPGWVSESSAFRDIAQAPPAELEARRSAAARYLEVQNGRLSPSMSVKLPEFEAFGAFDSSATATGSGLERELSSQPSVASSETHRSFGRRRTVKRQSMAVMDEGGSADASVGYRNEHWARVLAEMTASAVAPSARGDGRLHLNAGYYGGAWLAQPLSASEEALVDAAPPPPSGAMGESVDFLSAEVLHQLSYAKLTDTFGADDARCAATRHTLLAIYVAQGTERAEAAAELRDFPEAHAAALLAKAADLQQAADYFLSDDSGNLDRLTKEHFKHLAQRALELKRAQVRSTPLPLCSEFFSLTLSPLLLFARRSARPRPRR